MKYKPLKMEKGDHITVKDKREDNRKLRHISKYLIKIRNSSVLSVYAQVLDNNDPLGKGRIRASIMGLMESQDASVLPWMEFKSPFVGGNDSGSLIVPGIGEWVIVEEEYPGTWIYTGTWNTSSDKPKDYTSPTTRVLYKSSLGATIYIDDTSKEEKIRIIDRAGQCIEMSSPCLEDTDRRGSKNVIDGDGIDINNILSSAHITIRDLNGNQIKLTADVDGGKIELSLANGTTQLTLDGQTGDLTIDTASKVNVNADEIDLTADTVKLGNGAEGIHTHATIPYSDFSGRPYAGLPNILAG